jgi:ketosteroid isomerase-like protein
MATGTLLNRRQLLGRAGAGVLAAGGLFFGKGGVIASAETDDGREDGDQVAAIYRLQAAFHDAATHKNLGLMGRVWAEDAVFDNAGLIITGRAAILDWFKTHAGSFQPQNHWVSLAPSFRTEIKVSGETASLSFECDYVDVNATPKKVVTAELGLSGTVRRFEDTWFFWRMAGGPKPLVA